MVNMVSYLVSRVLITFSLAYISKDGNICIFISYLIQLIWDSFLSVYVALTLEMLSYKL